MTALRHPSQIAHSPSAFRLTAEQHALVAALLEQHADKLNELTVGLGSPLHIVLPQVFRENVRRLQRIFTEYGLNATLLYAKKANKAACFAQACAELGIGIDVASREEFAKALAAGVSGESIGISGPEKNPALLTLALQHHSLIAIDSPDELQRLFSLATRLRIPARVLLRIRPLSQQNSRFGLTPQEQETALKLCIAQADILSLEGFSFHLSGYSVTERAHTASAMIDACRQAQADGLSNCRHVNAGGGLPVQYITPQRWEAFLQQNAPEHYHASKSFTGFYPYGSASNSAQALRDLLEHPVAGGLTLAQQARQANIGFIVEPGRAFLDQAGITLFTVQGVKDRHASEGYAIATVQGSSLSLSEQWFNSEFLPDPLLLGHTAQGTRTFLACIGGSTCLENDLLTWRKIGFPRRLCPGDQLLYLNSAGYQMDSNESSFHEAPLPRKVVMELHDDEAAPRWHLDER